MNGNVYKYFILLNLNKQIDVYSSTKYEQNCKKTQSDYTMLDKTGK